MFVVEPGDGTEPLANSYVSVEEFVSYWTDRGFDYTVYTTGAVQRALIKATDYIDLENKYYFKGYILEEDQPLAFPRQYLYVECRLIEGIPEELKRATFEYAKRVLTGADDGNGELQPDGEDRDETGAIIVKKFEKIGPIETETEYLAGTGSEVRSYPSADKWLLPFLKGTCGSIRN
jgi:hypothetical protein